MTTTSDDSFRLGISWGAMLAAAEYEEESGELPSWLLPAFHAMCDALEKVPAEHRDPVIAAALDEWSKADN